MYREDESDDFLEGFPLADSLDNEILMHRDAHFGGKFSFMVDYYDKEGKGASSDIPLDRILFLSYLEEQTGQNLASLLLSGTESERVARAKSAYKKLRDLYEAANAGETPRLIADLILSEEEFPEKEITQVVAKGSSLVPALVDLLISEEFVDPLFPGYGTAPELAAICLGKIGDDRAIYPLFESLGKEGFFMEETVLEALRNIGEKAKKFLLKMASTVPITKENDKAALALTYFSEDSEVASFALKQLQTPDIASKPLSTYLVLICEGLKEKKERETFKKLATSKQFSPSLIEEMKLIIRSWH